MRLATLTQAQLDDWVVQAREHASRGRLPNYIPQLARVDSHLFAVQVKTIVGHSFCSGDFAQPFVLMSVVKPFLLLFLLERLGTEAIFQRVGMEPSDQPFHSLTQLTIDHGRPRNPMINSGTLSLTDFMPGKSGEERCEVFCQWLNQSAQAQLVLDQKMLASVRSLPNGTNRAIANSLRKSGNLNRVDLALDTYNHLCCLSGTISDLAQLGLLLTRSQLGIAESHQRIVKALMLTCGLYETSGAFAVRIGLPTKSGVSGALLSVMPGEGAIACYSPPIDAIGNSVAGLVLLEKISQVLNLSIFG